MSKKSKATKNAKPSLQIKKDAKGRFWIVPKDGGPEKGPYDNKKKATDAKAALASGAAPAPAAEKPAKTKKAKEPKAKRVSAIDAAALVEAMATQGLWSSPNGKTPHATLYSAIIREIATKGRKPGS